MWLVLATIGMPPHVVAALRTLYTNNHHHLSFAGRLFYAFCGTLRAYADVLALVLTQVWTQAPAVAHLFLNIEAMSRLKLKAKKCVIILLWKSSKDSCSALLKNMCSRGLLFG